MLSSNGFENFKKKQARIKRVNKIISTIVVFMCVLIFASAFVAHPIYRSVTFNDTVITPTNYALTTNSDGESVREVMATEGEYRVYDTWFMPYNRASGRIANEINEAVKRNDSALVRLGEYDQVCEVSTWGVRFEMLSMYPVIYKASCHAKTKDTKLE